MIGELAGVYGAVLGIVALMALFAAFYAVAELTKTRIELARLDERAVVANNNASWARSLANDSHRHALSAMTESARALVKADSAHVEVEAAKKATHTIQMVPVDDVADKALNLNMDGLEDTSAATFSDLERATAGMENLL